MGFLTQSFAFFLALGLASCSSDPKPEPTEPVQVEEEPAIEPANEWLVSRDEKNKLLRLGERPQFTKESVADLPAADSLVN